MSEEYSSSSSDSSYDSSEEVDDGEENYKLVMSENFNENDYDDYDLMTIYKSAYFYLTDFFYQKGKEFNKKLAVKTVENEQLTEENTKLKRVHLEMNDVLQELKSRLDESEALNDDYLSKYQNELREHNETIRLFNELKNNSNAVSQKNFIASFQFEIENGKVKTVKQIESQTFDDDNVKKIQILESKLLENERNLKLREEECSESIAKKSKEVDEIQQKCNELQKEMNENLSTKDSEINKLQQQIEQLTKEKEELKRKYKPLPQLPIKKTPSHTTVVQRGITRKQKTNRDKLNALMQNISQGIEKSKLMIHDYSNKQPIISSVNAVMLIQLGESLVYINQGKKDSINSYHDMKSSELLTLPSVSAYVEGHKSLYFYSPTKNEICRYDGKFTTIEMKNFKTFVQSDKEMFVIDTDNYCYLMNDKPLFMFKLQFEVGKKPVMVNDTIYSIKNNKLVQCRVDETKEKEFGCVTDFCIQKNGLFIIQSEEKQFISVDSQFAIKQTIQLDFKPLRIKAFHDSVIIVGINRYDVRNKDGVLIYSGDTQLNDIKDFTIGCTKEKGDLRVFISSGRLIYSFGTRLNKNKYSKMFTIN